LIAGLCISTKKAPDEQFLNYLPLIERYSHDSRNFVRKAVNWALRQIGKKNENLRHPALELAEKLSASSDKTAAWIGKDAARELKNRITNSLKHR
jgi:3-methyladenine DNA glycosylase AlkD